MRKFYAVQIGDNYDCDNGSTVKREAVKMALTQGVSVITGGPGTGKSMMP